MFVLRFTDDGGTVLAKASFEIGATVELSVQSTAPGGHAALLAGEVTALEVEVEREGRAHGRPRASTSRTASSAAPASRPTST